MPDFDYGNARLRALKSRLLTARDLDSLSTAESINGLIASLIKTAYRKPVETALTRTSGLDCISEALHYDLLQALGKVGNFYEGEAGQMVAILLRRYDIHNLKSILRGLSRNVETNEIISTMIPVGELKANVLAELARSPDPRAAMDLIAMLGLPFAQPLMKLRSEHPGAETAAMELALEDWFYQETYLYLKEARRTSKVLLQAIQIEADLVNLMTVLRFVHAPDERKLLHEWLHIDDFADLLVGPGRLPFELLINAANQDTVEAAVDLFASTPYAFSLTAGLGQFAKSALLSEFEKQLQRFRLSWMASQISKDPLGIGVFLGYLALKINEINNIRWIAHGINLGVQAKDIQTELEYPP